jgi:hypothetical protein
MRFARSAVTFLLVLVLVVVLGSFPSEWIEDEDDDEDEHDGERVVHE